MSFDRKKIFKLLGLKHAISKTIYEDASRQVENLSGILYVVFVKVFPQVVIWPLFVLSLIKYFATDLGGDAFELPILLWYVSAAPMSLIDFSSNILFPFNCTFVKGYHSIGNVQWDIWLPWLGSG